MNKYEKALLSISTFKNTSMMCGKSLKDLRELVERATPKKLFNGIECPHCNWINKTKKNYCLDCGQALDWSE